MSAYKIAPSFEELEVGCDVWSSGYTMISPPKNTHGKVVYIRKNVYDVVVEFDDWENGHDGYDGTPPSRFLLDNSESRWWCTNSHLILDPPDE